MDTFGSKPVKTLTLRLHISTMDRDFLIPSKVYEDPSDESKQKNCHGHLSPWINLIILNIWCNIVSEQITEINNRWNQYVHGLSCDFNLPQGDIWILVIFCVISLFILCKGKLCKGGDNL